MGEADSPSAEHTISLVELSRAIAVASPPPRMATRIVAIDGGGGAGKSTLAALLGEALGHVPVVHTDDFASWDNPLEWWPRLIEQVLEPLSKGLAPRYQRYDWDEERLAEWITLDPPPRVLVLEGVSACRLAFEPYLSYRIWVETPRDLRLARGLARDGEDSSDLWDDWMADEDAYAARENPRGRADLVGSGESDLAGGLLTVLSR